MISLPKVAVPLLAYAAGDAFGVHYEFLVETPKEIPQVLLRKEGWPFGGVSDDTLLSMLTIKSLNQKTPTDAATFFLEILRGAMPRLRGLGPTTRTALGLEVKVGERGVIGETNGAIMRTALCGLYIKDNRNEWIKALVEVTHYSPKAIECAQIAAGLFAGEDFPDYSEWTPPIGGISLDPLETLQAVVWVVNRAENCAEAFALACSLGGDTDTVAALAGALFAARWPEKSDFYSIPWINDVRWSEIEDDLQICAQMLEHIHG
ncbi:MAG: ADP-ribosylglycohydrolase family protein [Actinomycetales bacterium]|nr:ADP-ribosylglycohydrolase family protein [Actinomycetales bacterium]